MTTNANHDAVRDMLAMAALDALPPEELAQLDRHLTTCDACKHDLGALRDAVAQIPKSLPPRPMSSEREAEIRARLRARALEDRENVTPIRASSSPSSSSSSSRTSRAETAQPSRSSAARWLAAAALLLAVGAIAYGVDKRATVERLASDVAHLRDSTTTMEKRLADQQAVLDGLTGPGVRVMDVGATNAKQPYARMFWDQPTNRWTFVAYNLPATAPGRTYQLWLVTKDQKKVSAGTFVPTPSGAALVRATYELAGDNLAAVAVTTEPSGGSAQPTTTPFLVGPAAKTD